MSTKVYCNVYVTALDNVAPSCGQQESGSHCMPMCSHIRTSLSVREFLSVHKITELPHVPYSPDLSPCDYSLFPWLNKHWKATVTMMSGHSDSRDKTTLQHSSKCFAGLLQRPQEMLEAVHWCRRKLFQRRLLAPECKYTTFILIPSVSELSGHTIHTNTLLSTDINIHSNVA